MAKEIRKITRSKFIEDDLTEIFQYGVETFGKMFADIFLEEIIHNINGLSFQYLIYPECKYLETKNQIYRNIILGKYLIIYRIKAEKIEVLRAFHGSQSPKKIKKIRGIRL